MIECSTISIIAVCLGCFSIGFSLCRLLHIITGGHKMNEHDATELAYKNGYKQGTVDAVLKMQESIEERCIDGGIYPAFVKNVVESVAKELLEDVPPQSY